VQAGPTWSPWAGCRRRRGPRVIEYSIEEAATSPQLRGDGTPGWTLREQEGVALSLMNLGLKLEEFREEVLNLLGIT